MTRVQQIVPFREAEVRSAIGAGFSFVCAMCARLHEARTLHPEVPWPMTRCTGEGCVGPLGRGTYPKYAGPVRDSLDKFCWRCGSQAVVYAVSKADEHHGRLLGCCAEHHTLLREGEFEERRAGTPRKRVIDVFGNKVEL